MCICICMWWRTTICLDACIPPVCLVVWAVSCRVFVSDSVLLFVYSLFIGMVYSGTSHTFFSLTHYCSTDATVLSVVPIVQYCGAQASLYSRRMICYSSTNKQLSAVAIFRFHICNCSSVFVCAFRARSLVPRRWRCAPTPKKVNQYFLFQRKNCKG